MYCKRTMHRIMDVLPRSQRIELNSLGGQEMRAAGHQGMFGDARESAKKFLEHAPDTKAKALA
jgi:hypothetical protein